MHMSHLMSTKLTRLIFSQEVKWKDKDDLLNWVRHQANRWDLQLLYVDPI